MHELLCLGWRPRRNVAAFVEWDPRDANTAGDHAANHALDDGSDWTDGMGQQQEENVKTVCRRGDPRWQKCCCANCAVYVQARGGTGAGLQGRASPPVRTIHVCSRTHSIRAGPQFRDQCLHAGRRVVSSNSAAVGGSTFARSQKRKNGEY